MRPAKTGTQIIMAEKNLDETLGLGYNMKPNVNKMSNGITCTHRINQVLFPGTLFMLDEEAIFRNFHRLNTPKNMSNVEAKKANMGIKSF